MGVTIEVLLPLALSIIMFSLGLGLGLDDFRRVATQPRAFVAGLVSQVLLLPAVAFLVAVIWAPPPALAIGLMIIAAAPGGVTSNLLTRYAGGDVALSVTLTAVTSLAAMVTVPIVVLLAFAHFGGEGAAAGLSMTGIAIRMFAIVVVPAALGMALRGARPALAARIEPAVARLSGVLFVVVVGAAIWAERGNIATYFAAAGLATLALNLVMMAIAFWGPALVGCARHQRIALSLECGLQNGTLAIAVVAALGLDAAHAVPAAIYSLLMFATAFGFVALVRGGRDARAAG
ncbi:bile acid:sodium symporter family protein [Roseomonas sp. PWR1]|uniref:Bile acid:sodium symporter family protein n=1 Tax=Roseomonas nitratireducens TaxID=2820810 RepID=A0ABS4AT93_9PROT|nr:bile acid:sodium symporter family protein [Neoroseomonas nitratireducens]MBP0464588.1 bile acid:sodium symporter family protein [Neoroseomonas nitratireducens]